MHFFLSLFNIFLFFTHPLLASYSFSTPSFGEKNNSLTLCNIAEIKPYDPFVFEPLSETCSSERNRNFIEENWRKILGSLQKGDLETTSGLYEKLLELSDLLSLETKANLLGQYLWIQLKTSLKDLQELTTFLRAQIQSEPQLLSQLSIWEAIWNLLQALSADTKFEEALQFFQNIKTLTVEIPMPSDEVSTYNLFIEIYLLDKCQYSHTSYLKAQELLTHYHCLENDSIRQYVNKHLLFQLGKQELLQGKLNLALLHFKVLQEKFPQSSLDTQSRLLLLEWYHSKSIPEKATSILQEFLEKYPKHPEIPRFLYILAQQMRAKGTQYYPQVLHYLEIITQSHADSNFYLPTRLLEGELLRELRHFPSALLLYENLLKKTDLSETLKAFLELLYVRCLLALPSKNEHPYENAIAILNSRLSPELPNELSLEIRFTQILLLYEIHQLSEAKCIAFQALNHYLPLPFLSPKERYWLKRTIRITINIALSEDSDDDIQKLEKMLEQLHPE